MAVKILRAYSRATPKSAQGGPAHRFGQAQEVSKNDPTLKTQVVTTRKSVRRLFVKDPYNQNSVTGIHATGRTQALFSPVQDQFTNNPNVKFDPSRHVTSAAEKSTRSTRLAAQRPGKASRGHAKAITPPVTNLRLVRR